MTNIVISAFKRTPFQPSFRGAFIHARPDDMAATVAKALVQTSGIDPNLIEDLKLGCAYPEGEQGLNVARLTVFLAGLPITIGGVTTNRFCGSSMTTIHDAAGAIKMGAGEAFLCLGVEHMTGMPMTGLSPMPNPKLFEDYPEAYEGMGITAENLANNYKIARKDQEAFALDSHKKAIAAQQAGHFKEEIIAFDGIDSDGCMRESTAEKLATLKPAFDAKGSVTAATSSPLTDGASGVLVTSEAFADKHKLPKLARIKAISNAGCKPEIMGIGPVPAVHKVMDRAGLTMQDMDVIELNEAFSAQSMAVIQDLKIDESKLNIDGGAIAIGHPLGASGARITGKAASLLNRTGGKYALATMCIGGGQGVATILEKI